MAMTNDELETLTAGVIDLATKFGPIGVRGLFYQTMFEDKAKSFHVETECSDGPDLGPSMRTNGKWQWTGKRLEKSCRVSSGTEPYQHSQK